MSSRLLVLGLLLVLRLVLRCKCGRFHGPEPKEFDPPEISARAVSHRKARQGVLQFGHLRPLYKQSLDSQQQAQRAA
jgi:hypothetical protein